MKRCLGLACVVLVGLVTSTLQAEGPRGYFRYPSVHGQTVVFTGAMKPERFRDSDAAFNLGVAVGACNALPAGSGVYVCMNGQVLRSDKVVRDLDSGLFLPVV